MYYYLFFLVIYYIKYKQYFCICNIYTNDISRTLKSNGMTSYFSYGNQGSNFDRSKISILSRRSLSEWPCTKAAQRKFIFPQVSEKKPKKNTPIISITQKLVLLSSCQKFIKPLTDNNNNSICLKEDCIRNNNCGPFGSWL